VKEHLQAIGRHVRTPPVNQLPRAGSSYEDESSKENNLNYEGNHSTT